MNFVSFLIPSFSKLNYDPQIVDYLREERELFLCIGYDWTV